MVAAMPDLARRGGGTSKKTFYVSFAERNGFPAAARWIQGLETRAGRRIQRGEGTAKAQESGPSDSQYSKRFELVVAFREGWCHWWRAGWKPEALQNPSNGIGRMDRRYNSHLSQTTRAF